MPTPGSRRCPTPYDLLGGAAKISEHGHSQQANPAGMPALRSNENKSSAKHKRERKRPYDLWIWS